MGVASAGATSSIEGVWSFNGGQVAIQPSSSGTFVGIVVAQTKFAECVHPAGLPPMWEKISLQADGSYWGTHRWYFEGSSCHENPEPGPTVWRVLEEADGAHYLRVCFSSPGTSQPTIAANGAPKNPSEYGAYHVTYGCVNSALTAALPTAASVAPRLKRSVTLPRSAGKFFSNRVFRIHLRDPKNDPLKEVVVTLRGHRITVVRHAGVIISAINLKGLPKGTFTVNIHATTVLGHHLSESRTYHTCVKKPKKSKKPGKKG
ncbi:MAG TPA: hypothetical protein VGI24_10150 [Solirubrobacteraceae bacterium]